MKDILLLNKCLYETSAMHSQRLLKKGFARSINDTT